MLSNRQDEVFSEQDIDSPSAEFISRKPFFTTVELDGENDSYKSMQIASWNIEEISDYKDDSAVYEKVCSGLKNIARNTPEFIVVQGVNKDNGVINKAVLALREAYAVASKKDGGVVFYRKNKITIRNEGVLPKNKKFIGNSVLFFLNGQQEDKSNNEVSTSTYKPQQFFMLYNIYPLSKSHSPVSSEEALSELLLDEKRKQIASIVVGHFGCYLTAEVATEDLSVHNFREQDGCFYVTHTEDDNHLQQSRVRHFNVHENHFYGYEEYERDLNSLSASEREEVEDFEMVMCVDAMAHDKRLFNGKALFENEEYFRQALAEEGFCLRFASNSNYEQALAVQLSAKYANFIELIDAHHFKIKVYAEQNDQERHVVFTQLKNTRYLFCILEKMMDNSRLVVLAQNILALEQSEISHKRYMKIQAVFKSLMLEDVDVAAESYASIIESFIKMTDHLLLNPTLSESEIQKFCDELDTNLYGKPPIKPAVYAAICGFVGAVLFGIAGFMVVAALTGWSGGFGALPAAIKASAEGYTLGVAVGTTIGMVGGGALGFFSGKNNVVEYAIDKQQSKAYVKEVADSVEEVNPSKLSCYTLS